VKVEGFPLDQLSQLFVEHPGLGGKQSFPVAAAGTHVLKLDFHTTGDHSETLSITGTHIQNSGGLPGAAPKRLKVSPRRLRLLDESDHDAEAQHTVVVAEPDEAKLKVKLAGEAPQGGARAQITSRGRTKHHRKKKLRAEVCVPQGQSEVLVDLLAGGHTLSEDFETPQALELVAISGCEIDPDHARLQLQLMPRVRFSSKWIQPPTSTFGAYGPGQKLTISVELSQAAPLGGAEAKLECASLDPVSTLVEFAEGERGPVEVVVPLKSAGLANGDAALALVTVKGCRKGDAHHLSKDDFKRSIKVKALSVVCLGESDLDAAAWILLPGGKERGGPWRVGDKAVVKVSVTHSPASDVTVTLKADSGGAFTLQTNEVVFTQDNVLSKAFEVTFVKKTTYPANFTISVDDPKKAQLGKHSTRKVKLAKPLEPKIVGTSPEEVLYHGDELKVEIDLGAPAERSEQIGALSLGDFLRDPQDPTSKTVPIVTREGKKKLHVIGVVHAPDLQGEEDRVLKAAPLARTPRPWTPAAGWSLKPEAKLSIEALPLLLLSGKPAAVFDDKRLALNQEVEVQFSLGSGAPQAGCKIRLLVSDQQNPPRKETLEVVFPAGEVFSKPVSLRFLSETTLALLPHVGASTVKDWRVSGCRVSDPTHPPKLVVKTEAATKAELCEDWIRPRRDVFHVGEVAYVRVSALGKPPTRRPSPGKDPVPVSATLRLSSAHSVIDDTSVLLAPVSPAWKSGVHEVRIRFVKESKKPDGRKSATDTTLTLASRTAELSMASRTASPAFRVVAQRSVKLSRRGNLLSRKTLHRSDKAEFEVKLDAPAQGPPGHKPEDLVQVGFLRSDLFMADVPVFVEVGATKGAIDARLTASGEHSVKLLPHGAYAPKGTQEVELKVKDFPQVGFAKKLKIERNQSQQYLAGAGERVELQLELSAEPPRAGCTVRVASKAFAKLGAPDFQGIRRVDATQEYPGILPPAAANQVYTLLKVASAHANWKLNAGPRSATVADGCLVAWDKANWTVLERLDAKLAYPGHGLIPVAAKGQRYHLTSGVAETHAGWGPIADSPQGLRPVDGCAVEHDGDRWHVVRALICVDAKTAFPHASADSLPLPKAEVGQRLVVDKAKQAGAGWGALKEGEEPIPDKGALFEYDGQDWRLVLRRTYDVHFPAKTKKHTLRAALDGDVSSPRKVKLLPVERCSLRAERKEVTFKASSKTIGFAGDGELESLWVAEASTPFRVGELLRPGNADELPPEKAQARAIERVEPNPEHLADAKHAVLWVQPGAHTFAKDDALVGVGSGAKAKVVRHERWIEPGPYAVGQAVHVYLTCTATTQPTAYLRATWGSLSKTKDEPLKVEWEVGKRLSKPVTIPLREAGKLELEITRVSADHRIASDASRTLKIGERLAYLDPKLGKSLVVSPGETRKLSVLLSSPAPEPIALRLHSKAFKQNAAFGGYDDKRCFAATIPKGERQVEVEVTFCALADDESKTKLELEVDYEALWVAHTGKVENTPPMALNADDEVTLKGKDNLDLRLKVLRAVAGLALCKSVGRGLRLRQAPLDVDKEALLKKGPSTDRVRGTFPLVAFPSWSDRGKRASLELEVKAPRVRMAAERPLGDALRTSDGYVLAAGSDVTVAVATSLGALAGSKVKLVSQAFENDVSFDLTKGATRHEHTIVGIKPQAAHNTAAPIEVRVVSGPVAHDEPNHRTLSDVRVSTEPRIVFPPQGDWTGPGKGEPWLEPPQAVVAVGDKIRVRVLLIGDLLDTAPAKAYLCFADAGTAPERRAKAMKRVEENRKRKAKHKKPKPPTEVASYKVAFEFRAGIGKDLWIDVTVPPLGQDPVEPGEKTPKTPREPDAKKEAPSFVEVWVEAVSDCVAPPRFVHKLFVHPERRVFLGYNPLALPFKHRNAENDPYVAYTAGQRVAVVLDDTEYSIVLEPRSVALYTAVADQHYEGKVCKPRLDRKHAFQVERKKGLLKAVLVDGPDIPPSWSDPQTGAKVFEVEFLESRRFFPGDKLLAELTLTVPAPRGGVKVLLTGDPLDAPVTVAFEEGQRAKHVAVTLKEGQGELELSQARGCALGRRKTVAIEVATPKAAFAADAVQPPELLPGDRGWVRIALDPPPGLGGALLRLTCDKKVLVSDHVDGDGNQTLSIRVPEGEAEVRVPFLIAADVTGFDNVHKTLKATFKLSVVADEEVEHPWLKTVRAGTGATTTAEIVIKDVPKVRFASAPVKGKVCAYSDEDKRYAYDTALTIGDKVTLQVVLSAAVDQDTKAVLRSRAFGPKVYPVVFPKESTQAVEVEVKLLCGVPAAKVDELPMPVELFLRRGGPRVQPDPTKKRLLLKVKEPEQAVKKPCPLQERLKQELDAEADLDKRRALLEPGKVSCNLHRLFLVEEHGTEKHGSINWPARGANEMGTFEVVGHKSHATHPKAALVCTSDLPVLQVIAGRRYDPKLLPPLTKADKKLGKLARDDTTFVGDDEFHATRIRVQLSQLDYWCDEEFPYADDEARAFLHPHLRVEEERVTKDGALTRREWIPVDGVSVDVRPLIQTTADEKKKKLVGEEILKGKKEHAAIVEFPVYQGHHWWHDAEDPRHGLSKPQAGLRQNAWSALTGGAKDLLSSLTFSAMKPRRYRVLVESCGHAKGTDAKGPTARLGAIIEVYPSDEFAISYSHAGFEGAYTGTTGEQVQNDGTLVQQSGKDDDRGSGLSQEEYADPTDFDAQSGLLRPGAFLLECGEEYGIKLPPDGFRPRSLSTPSLVFHAVGLEGEDVPPWDVDYDGANNKSKLAQDLTSGDKSLLGKGHQSWLEGETLSLALTRNGQGDPAYWEVINGCAAVIATMSALCRVTSSWDGYKASAGFGCQFSFKFLQGSLQAYWGYKEDTDAKVFKWFALHADLMLLAINFNLTYGWQAKCCLANFEAVLYVKIAGELLLKGGCERQPGGANPSMIETGYSLTTRVEGGARIVLVNENCFHLNAALKTGWKADFKLLNLAENPFGIEYRLYWLGLAFGITFKIATYKIVDRDIYLIRPDSSPEHPWRKGTWPERASSGWGYLRQEVADHWKKAAFVRGSVKQRILDYQTIQLQMLLEAKVHVREVVRDGKTVEVSKFLQTETIPGYECGLPPDHEDYRTRETAWRGAKAKWDAQWQTCVSAFQWESGKARKKRGNRWRSYDLSQRLARTVEKLELGLAELIDVAKACDQALRDAGKLEEEIADTQQTYDAKLSQGRLHIASYDLPPPELVEKIREFGKREILQFATGRKGRHSLKKFEERLGDLSHYAKKRAHW
jgi:hypothetical protein